MESAMRCRLRWAAMTFVPVLFASCLEPPVADSLSIRFADDGGAVAEARTSLTLDDDLLRRPAVAERVARTSQDLLASRDPWSRAFERIDADEQRTTLERRHGRLSGASWIASVSDPATLSPLFSGGGAEPFYSARDGTAEFVLSPTGASLATTAERRRLRTEEEAWCREASEYLAALSALHRYLRSRPERAEACFGSHFLLLLAPEARETLPVPTDEEKELLERLDAAEQGVLSMFAVSDQDATSLDEIARRVHDPLAAPLTLEVPGPIIEVEGFLVEAGGRLRAPDLDLWGAFERAARRFAYPLPLGVWVERLRGDPGGPFSLADYVAKDRSASSPPSAEDLRAVVEKELEPPASYRVRWRQRSAAAEP